MSIIKSGRIPAAAFVEVLQTVKVGKTWVGTLSSRRKDGTTYADRVCILPLMDQQGRMTHFVGIQTEIPQVLDPGD